MILTIAQGEYELYWKYMDWLKQAPDKPLFPDLLWSRPENRATAGKLLIIGGNSHGFTSPANAFMAAQKAAVGTIRVILPDKLQKTVHKLFPEAIFAPSTLSGGLAKTALAQSIEVAEWADGVLLAGDFGKNSETAILLESLLSKYEGLTVASGDAIDFHLNSPDKLLLRKYTTVVADFSQLQAIAKLKRRSTPLTSDTGLYGLVGALGQWSTEIEASLITYHEKAVIVALDGKISTTPVKSINWPELAAFASVWWLQNSAKKFESLTTAVFDYQDK